MELKLRSMRTFKMPNGILNVIFIYQIHTKRFDEIHDSVFFLASTVTRKAVIYECCPTVYPFVLFTLRIRRRTLYYVINIVGKIFDESAIINRR